MQKYSQPLQNSGSVSIFSAESLLGLLYMLPVLNGYLSEVLVLWERQTLTDYVYIFTFFLSGLTIVLALIRKPATSLFTILLLLFAPAVSFLAKPEIYRYTVSRYAISLRIFAQNEFFTLLALCLPLLLLCQQRIDTAKLYRVFRNHSILIVSMFVAVMVLHIFFYNTKLNYMSVAYNAMFSILFLYYDARERKNRLSGLLWLAAAVGILVGGCRGAALLLVSVVALWELRRLFPLTGMKFLGLLLVFVLAVILIINFRQILSAVDSLFSNLGYSSRLLEKYFGRAKDGDLFHMDDRNKIYSTIAVNITAFGRGVFSDRLVLRGSYSHNMILEILYQFGWVIGVPLLFGLAAFVLTALKRSRRRESKGSFLHFAVFSFGIYLCTKMMVSASYLTDRTFWLYLGLCLIAFRQPRPTFERSSCNYEANPQVPDLPDPQAAVP